MTQYVLIDIGCIECGYGSNIAGKFSTEKEAAEWAEQLNKHCSNGGQHNYEVFRLPEESGILPEYVELLGEYK